MMLLIFTTPCRCWCIQRPLLESIRLPVNFDFTLREEIFMIAFFSDNYIVARAFAYLGGFEGVCLPENFGNLD